MSNVLRDRILAAKTFGDDEEYDVPEWGGPVFLRSPNGRERSRIQAVALKAQFDPDHPENINVEALNDLYPTAIISVVHDEDGEQVFEKGDIDVLMEMDGRLVERVGQKCLALLGLGEEVGEAGKDDSSTTSNSATGSSSPST